MKDDRIYLLHIRDSIDKTLSYTAKGMDTFFKESMAQDAVVRNIEIIGEACKNISSDLKTAHPEIPLKKIAGMRDKLIHEYFGVNLKIVWDVVEKEYPGLKKSILPLIGDFKGF